MSSSSPSAARPQRSSSNQIPSSTRHSKITVEYHRPSRESIQEYGALLDQAHMHAGGNNTQAFVPSRQAPPPPPASPSAFKPKEPLSPAKVRNSLQKPPPRNRKPSIQVADNSGSESPNQTDLRASAHYSPNMSGSSSPPARPSRTNTATLNDLFPLAEVETQPQPITTTTLAHRRISTPILQTRDPSFYADPSESMPPAPADNNYNSSAGGISTPNGTRSRSTTVSKGKKGVLGFMSDFLNSSKKPEISTRKHTRILFGFI